MAWATTLAAVVGPFLALLNAITAAGVLFVFRMRSDVSTALTVGFDLSAEITEDLREVQSRQASESLSLPSFSELINGVMHVVVVPVTISVVKKKIPIVGFLFSGLLRFLAGTATRLTVKRIERELPDAKPEACPDSAGEKESWFFRRLDELNRLAAAGKKMGLAAVNGASLVALVPALFLFGVAFSTAVGFYVLLFGAG